MIGDYIASLTIVKYQGNMICIRSCIHVNLHINLSKFFLLGLGIHFPINPLNF